MGGSSSPAPEAKRRRINTVAVHAGDQTDKGHNAIMVPITTATSFVQPNLNQAGDFVYARVDNPTRYAYETALADLEGGSDAFATASGMAAMDLALDLLPQNSHVLVQSGCYGGSFRLFETVRGRTSGMSFTYIDLNDTAALRAAVRENTRMVWVESPTNPLLYLVDIKAVVEAARAASATRGDGDDRIVVACDNTFATAYNQKPLELGADLVMLSASKYIGGHSDLIGGALVTSDARVAAELKRLHRATGALQSPFDCYLALRGMKTLALRMERQAENAACIARHLKGHPRVREVHHPALAEDEAQREICARQMRTGGPVVTIRLRLDDECVDAMRPFFEPLRYFVLAESLGGVESTVNHSASMSHGSMTPQERAAVGVFDATLRISVGVEDVEDLVEDLDRGLANLAPLETQA
eukprot:Rhum_TRINITY_DN9311_c0_g1::Rhum_TRINITY_DN9311_c0_g1_i2::g.32875::m.32875/K01758/CTH; cystathionine gamma-lyase